MPKLSEKSCFVPVGIETFFSVIKKTTQFSLLCSVIFCLFDFSFQTRYIVTIAGQPAACIEQQVRTDYSW